MKRDKKWLIEHVIKKQKHHHSKLMTQSLKIVNG